jgi:hypothetical protein
VEMDFDGVVEDDKIGVVGGVVEIIIYFLKRRKRCIRAFEC